MFSYATHLELEAPTSEVPVDMIDTGGGGEVRDGGGRRSVGFIRTIAVSRRPRGRISDLIALCSCYLLGAHNWLNGLMEPLKCVSEMFQRVSTYIEGGGTYFCEVLHDVFPRTPSLTVYPRFTRILSSL